MNIQEDFTEKIRGQSKYVNDIEPKNLVYGQVIGASIHKGRILKKNVPDLPKGYFYLDYKAIKGKNSLTLYNDKMPFLAERKINYFGEPVLLLCGPNRKRLRQLAAQIKIEYEEEKPVFIIDNNNEKQVCDILHFSNGDVKNSFARAVKIVEGEYLTREEEYPFLERQVAIAMGNRKNLTVYCSTQNPFHIRDELANLLALSSKQINVIVPDFALYPGEKETVPILISGYASLLAIESGKPVKIFFENMIISYPCKLYYKTALDKNGKIIAMLVNIKIDIGAYKINSPVILKRAVFSACGSYRGGNIDIRAYLIATNKVPYSLYINSGSHDSLFAAELHATRIAEAQDLDPYSWRVNNLFASQKNLFKKGVHKNNIGALAVLEHVVKQADFQRKYNAYEANKKQILKKREYLNPLRGIGLSLCFYGLDFLDLNHEKVKYSLNMVLARNNKLKIFTSAVERGQGLKALLCSIASKVLKIDEKKISIENVNTSLVSNSGPTNFNSTLMVIGRLVEQACQLLLKKKQHKKVFPIMVRKTFSLPKLKNLNQVIFQGDEIDTLSWCATVIEIEIDPLTFQVDCRGVWMTMDAGNILNPQIAINHTKNEITKGLNMVMYGLHNQKQKNLYQQLYTPIYLNFIESPYKYGPLGGKGIGELPIISVAPAFVAAVSQATGFNFNSFPLTPEKIQLNLGVE